MMKYGRHFTAATQALNTSRCLVIQVLNELPTDGILFKVPQGRLLCHTHVDNIKKNSKNCVTLTDLSGVPLINECAYNVCKK